MCRHSGDRDGESQEDGGYEEAHDGLVCLVVRYWPFLCLLCIWHEWPPIYNVTATCECLISHKDLSGNRCEQGVTACLVVTCLGSQGQPDNSTSANTLFYARGARSFLIILFKWIFSTSRRIVVEGVVVVVAAVGTR